MLFSKTNVPEGFYVYAYLREDGTPYYVGKGSGLRLYSKNRTINQPVDKQRIVILESNLTELGAFALERRMIRWWGRKDLGTGILHNRTDGGEGTKGRIVSDDTRMLIKDARTGVPRKPETIEKVRQAHLGRKLSFETIEKRTATFKQNYHGQNAGRKKTPEQCEAQSLRLKGKKQSAEHIKNKADALKGKTKSEETKKKISDKLKQLKGDNHPLKGRKLSPEAIAKRTASRRANKDKN